MSAVGESYQASYSTHETSAAERRLRVHEMSSAASMCSMRTGNVIMRRMCADSQADACVGNIRRYLSDKLDPDLINDVCDTLIHTMYSFHEAQPAIIDDLMHKIRAARDVNVKRLKSEATHAKGPAIELLKLNQRQLFKTVDDLSEELNTVLTMCQSKVNGAGLLEKVKKDLYRIERRGWCWCLAGVLPCGRNSEYDAIEKEKDKKRRIANQLIDSISSMSSKVSHAQKKIEGFRKRGNRNFEDLIEHVQYDEDNRDIVDVTDLDTDRFCAFVSDCGLHTLAPMFKERNIDGHSFVNILRKENFAEDFHWGGADLARIEDLHQACKQGRQVYPSAIRLVEELRMVFDRIEEQLQVMGQELKEMFPAGQPEQHDNKSH